MKATKSDFSLKEIVSPLLLWYSENARDLPWRRTKDPYHIWVSEIMLQQTRVEAVKPYYARFLKRLPTVADLAEIQQDELNKLWEGLGYYSRARNLKKAAEQITQEFGGYFPNTHAALLSLPGVGPYTAGAIGSIAFELPTPAVDGNVLRVYTRLTENRTSIADTALKKQVTAALADIYPTGHCGDFTQSLMELGATVCLPNGRPLCERCPLKDLCLAHQHGTQLEYPVMPPKQKRKKQKLTVFLLTVDDMVALNKREPTGLLAGLWEFPNTEGHLSPTEAATFLRQYDLQPTAIVPSVNHKHIFTHIEWDMTAYRVSVSAKNEYFTWVTQQELAEAYSLPTAFRQFVADLAK